MNQRTYNTYTLFIAILSTLFLSSCGSRKETVQLYDPKEVAHLSKKLSINLSNQNKDDDKNMPLYAESSLWIGTPYRYGGTSRKGTDCSGLVMQIFKKVYNKKLPRSTSGLAKSNYKKISKDKLATGDVILFATGKDKKTVSHAGIYLKDGKFIHASTSSGVIVSNLSDNYYQKAWVRAIRVK